MDNKTDFINRFVEKESSDELSPMNPPGAYSSQKIEFIPYEKMHPFLQQLIDEHQRLSDVLDKFERALINWRTNDWIFNKEIDEGLKIFFEFYDENIVEHNYKEEKILFPILNQKLIESGEHSTGEKRSTAIDFMEDEHIKIAQAVALVFNFLGLGSRLSDQKSKEITFESAFNQGIAVVETFRLHIHREENVLFLQSMHLFSDSDFINKRYSTPEQALDSFSAASCGVLNPEENKSPSLPFPKGRAFLKLGRGI